ncbi:MAG: hypothetical protein ING49_19570 [Rubrivivax sp.]|nr:hypothetical protein [Rubrivivax sp.]MCA3253905.1 hypothetical protein [Rubrivivax sp.]
MRRSLRLEATLALGVSGGRPTTTAIDQLCRTSGRNVLCTMCIGVGQGIAMVGGKVRRWFEPVAPASLRSTIQASVLRGGSP